MNWYELAGPDEVRQVLEQFLDTYGFISYRWARDTEYSVGVRISEFPSQAYEIAEALWAEYSEELF